MDDFGDEWANYTGDSSLWHDIELVGDVDRDESQKKPKKARKKRASRVGTTTTIEHLKIARIDEVNGEVGKRATGESPEGNIVVKFSNPEHRGMGSVEDSATMYLQRSSYSGSAWNDQRKHAQTEAIRRGKESTPKIPGSKKMIVRAAIVGMLNASHRSLPSPILPTSRCPVGVQFEMQVPMKAMFIILECFKAFSAQDSLSAWDMYIASMLQCAGKRVQGAALTSDELRMWHSFQSLLRAAEVGPARMSNEGIKTKKKGIDWLNDPKWLVSHDIVAGVVMDYERWHYIAQGQPTAATSLTEGRELAAIASSPYSPAYVPIIQEIIASCMKE